MTQSEQKHKELLVLYSFTVILHTVLLSCVTVTPL